MTGTGKNTPRGVGTGHKRAHADTRITQTNLTAILTTHPHDHASTGTVPVSVCGHHTPWLCIHNSGRGKCSLVCLQVKQASKKVKRPSRGRESFPTVSWRERAAVSTPRRFSCAGRCAGTQTAELRAPTPSDHPRSSNKNIAYSSRFSHTNYTHVHKPGCVTTLKNTTMIAPAQALKSHWQQLSKLPTHMPTHRTRHVYSPGVCT